MNRIHAGFLASGSLEFEYACHEGNLAMRNISSGAPAAEAAAR